MPDGDYRIRFALYDQLTGGTELWFENRDQAPNLLPVSNGVFNVLLGSLRPLDPSVLSSTVYLGITVEGEELTPREQLASVPFALFALQSSVADGVVTTVKLADGAVTEAKLSDGAVTPSKLDRDYVDKAGDTMTGNLDIGGNQINTVTKLSSPGDSGLVIDAGAGTARTLTLHDEVRIPDGDLDLVNHQVKSVTRISSSGDSDLVIDAGDGPRRTLFLHDDIDIHDGDLKVAGGHKIFTTWLGSLGGSDLAIDAGFGSENKIRLADHLDAENHNIERVRDIWVQTLRSSGDLKLSPAGSVNTDRDIRVGNQLFVSGNLGDGFLQIPRKNFDPSNPVNGMIYYNNAANCLRIYANGSWRNLQCW